MSAADLSSISHAPADYRCPFCALLRGEFDERNDSDDILFQDDLVFARVAPKWWPANPGSALVLPTAHYENLYDVPSHVGAAIWDLTRRVALAIRATSECTGTSTRQHNEPAGNQDVWHLHVHVFPRYTGDDLYQRHGQARWVSLEERRPYADALRAVLEG